MGLAETVKEWYSDVREEGREEGFEKGEILGAEKERAKFEKERSTFEKEREKERAETVRKMFENGLDIRMISRCTGLSVEEIKNIK